VLWVRRRRERAWDILAVELLVASLVFEYESAYWRGGAGVGGHGMRRDRRSCWRICPKPTHCGWLYVYEGIKK
jgi:hypothetical protein